MMEESCDECNIPLMRSKDKKTELCVQCKRNYKEPPKTQTKPDV